MKPDYIIYQGEPLILSLLVIEGLINNVTTVEAVLKRAGVRGSIPNISAPIAANFIVNNTAAPDVGWDFIIPSNITTNLSPGYYITNAKINLSSGGPIKTGSVLIEIRGSVS